MDYQRLFDIVISPRKWKAGHICSRLLRNEALFLSLKVLSNDWFDSGSREKTPTHLACGL